MTDVFPKQAWPTLSLREAGVSLIDCEHRTPPSSDTGLPYVAIPQIKQGRLDLSEVRRISPEHFLEWTRKAHPKPYDVVLSRRCNPGETAFVPPGLECALGQNLVLLRADGTRVIPPFLRWLVRSGEWWEQIRRFLNVGAVFDSLKCADIPNFRLPIPPISDQHALVNILGTLDDKFELNRQMNETLEAMARAIFKAWFVDFEPVRAKVEGRQPFGMDAETAALFPNSFQSASLGNIPKGWRTDVLGSICKIAIGGDWGSDDPGDDSVQVVCLRGVDLELLRRDGFSKAPVRWVKKSSLDKRILDECDVLIAASGIGPVGRPLWACSSLQGVFEHPVIYSNFCKRLRTIAPEYAVYLDRVLHNMRTSHETWEYVNGTSIPNLDANDLLSSSVLVIPPTELLKRFHGVVAPIYRKLLSPENRILSAVRDALLPKLISGEIRVKDA
ncbi:MAG: restriction endonuclease subunit S [Acidobacteriia bacterium]|nr:restriction endonuclease subunit S [Terriglobia bacterium]